MPKNPPRAWFAIKIGVPIRKPTMRSAKKMSPEIGLFMEDLRVGVAKSLRPADWGNSLFVRDSTRSMRPGSFSIRDGAQCLEANVGQILTPSGDYCKPPISNCKSPAVPLATEYWSTPNLMDLIWLRSTLLAARDVKNL